MYSLPSTSQIFEPSACATKNGSAPTFRNARTGEFTPPGMRRCARAKSCDDREFTSANVQRSTRLRKCYGAAGAQRESGKVVEALAAASACFSGSALDTSAATDDTVRSRNGGVAKW